jgi:hypothetical protein
MLKAWASCEEIMKRAILILGVSLVMSTKAFADCAEEVAEAWTRLLKTPFSFEIMFEGPLNSNVTGSFSWPSAMHYSTHGRNGLAQGIFVGSRQWTYHDGAWSGGGGYGSTSDRALALHWVMFGFEMPHPTGKGIESAVCLGRVVMGGREYSAYEYRVKKSVMGEAIDHQRLYVDIQSGLQARKEVEREVVKPHDQAVGSRTRHSTEFRPDPTLKIEPPG